jgi:flavodoxin
MRKSINPTTRRTFLKHTYRALLYAAAGGSLLSQRTYAQPAGGSLENLKSLVVYHSRTGHTRTVANYVHALVGGDLVEIETVDPYPEDYDTLVALNVAQQQSEYKPPLQTVIENIRDYDIVFIGSPLWNVRLTPPARSFLSSHDLSGRTVVPFVTYIVSGMGRSRQDIQEICPEARLLDGLAILGEEATGAQTRVAEWLRNIQSQ